MPASRRLPWLVCYDITDDRRRVRVHRTVSRHATPFQYSVFRKSATRVEVVGVLQDVERLIEPTQDDVRAYALLTTGRHAVYGRSRLPGGVLFTDHADMLFVNR